MVAEFWIFRSKACSNRDWGQPVRDFRKLGARPSERQELASRARALSILCREPVFSRTDREVGSTFGQSKNVARGRGDHRALNRNRPRRRPRSLGPRSITRTIMIVIAYLTLPWKPISRQSRMPMIGLAKAVASSSLAVPKA